MMRIINLTPILILFLIFVPCISSATGFAWLIEWNKLAHKLDLSTYTVVNSVSIDGVYVSLRLDSEKEKYMFDEKANIFLYIYDKPGRDAGEGVKVLSLKDLSEKMDLDLVSKHRDFMLPKLFSTEDGENFYVFWVDASTETEKIICSIFSKTTLTKIKDITDFDINVYQPIYYSKEIGKVFSVDIDTNKISFYDKDTLKTTSNVSINQIWGSPLYGNYVVGHKGDKLLFVENIRGENDANNNIKYIVYSLSENKVLRRYNVNEAGSEHSTDDLGKLLIISIEEAFSPDGSYISKSKNIITLYDNFSGDMIKKADFSEKYSDLSFGSFGPDARTVFLYGNRKSDNTKIIIIVDIASFELLKEIEVRAEAIVFFNDGHG